jgi:hypothetical protein
MAPLTLAISLAAGVAAAKVPATIDPCLPQEIKEWDDLWQDSLGVDGRDPQAQNLFSEMNDRWPAATDGVHDWPPFHAQKAKLCGLVHHHDAFCPKEGPLGILGIQECDRTINVVPSPRFADLIEEAKTHDSYGPVKVDDCSGDECIHCEITPQRRLVEQESKWSEWLGALEQGELPPQRRTEICLYGPPVLDTGHYNHPELHPIQLFWLRRPDERKFVFFVLEDASARFNEKTQYIHAHRPDPSVWEAWAQPPLRGEFRVAYRSQVGSRPRLLLTNELPPHNVSTDQAFLGPPPALHIDGPLVPGASGDEPAATLTVEPSTAASLRQVQFEKACLATPGVVQGYLSFKTAVGRTGCGHEGFHVLALSEEGTTVATGASVHAGASAPTLAEVQPLPPAAAAPPSAQPPQASPSPRPAPSAAAARSAPAPASFQVAVARETPKDVANVSDAVALDAVRRALFEAAGTSVSAPAIPVRRVRRWEFVVGPHYGGSRIGDQWQEALSRNKSGQLKELMGVSESYRVTARWEEVQVSREDGTPATIGVRFLEAAKTLATPNPGEILVQAINAGATAAGISIAFPEDLPPTAVKVSFRVTLTDPLGKQGSLEHATWSHALGVAADTPKALVGALQPAILAALAGKDARAAEANDIVNSVARLGADGIVTVPELKRLVTRTRRFR